MYLVFDLCQSNSINMNFFSLPEIISPDEIVSYLSSFLLQGSYEKSIVKNADAGTLNLFNGLRSLHRVRTVYGPRKRIIAILSYHTEPNLKGAVQKNIKLYGERVEKIYRERGQVH